MSRPSASFAWPTRRASCLPGRVRGRGASGLGGSRRKAWPSTGRWARCGSGAEQSFEVEAVDVGLGDLLDAGFDLAEHRYAGAYLDAPLSQIGDPPPHG